MSYKEIKIKEGIKLHYLNTKKFKTNLFAIFISTPLKRETVTKNAVLTAVLKRGTQKLQSQEKINEELENMYGAECNFGIEKTGDNHIIKFYMETLNDVFLPEGQGILNESIDIFLDIVLNPLVEDESFNESYVEGEKQIVKKLIESKIDNKMNYAINRCTEIMYENKPYGLYKYGYIEDLENINSKSLYDYYKKLISECKIDIFISGNLEETVEDIIKNNENIQKLNERNPNYIINNEQTEKKENNEEKEIIEEMEIEQGKLVIGLNMIDLDKDSRFVALVYNTILGVGPSSKLFQNVREKESLAYSVGSSYIRQKNNIFIKIGIEVENYTKAVEKIKNEIEDIKNGKFTEENIQNAKKEIVSMVKNIPDEQDTEITYYLGQELSDSKMSVEEYIKKVEEVTKQQIIEIANKIQVDTIYFLKSKEEKLNANN